MIVLSIVSSLAATLSVSCGGGKNPCTDCVDAGGTDAAPDAPLLDAGHDAGHDAGYDAGHVSLGCPSLPGLYAQGSCTELAAGVVAFAPRYVLWSDDAVKDRFVYLPAGTTIDATNPDAWVFPVGTKFWKHFSIGSTRVETRMLEKVSSVNVGPDNWEMRTFLWNADGDDVTEQMDGVINALGTTHDIPAQNTCASCHRLADAPLGFSAIQLNNPNADVGMITLNYLLTNMKFGATPPAELTLATAQIPGDATATAAIGYLHANCGHCHSGSVGPVAGVNSFSMWNPLGLATVDQTPVYVTGVGVTSGWNALYQRIDAVTPAASAVYLRMNSRVPGTQMPQLATEIVHPAGLSTVLAWIEALP